jgi:hypothetical protein
MSQQGGKVNKSLKAWVAFVKKVQREEKLSYKDAIHRAKVRKDKGEKWMSGGDNTPSEVVEESVQVTPESEVVTEEEEVVAPESLQNIAGGKRTRRRSRGNARARTARRSRSRSARRSRGRGRY